MIEITEDVFDIARRIKSINPCYKLYFDKTDQKFKVYCKDVQQLILPFNSLDSRAVDYVLKTQVKNIALLESEIDKDNQKLFRDRENKQKEERLVKIENAVKNIKN